MGSHSKLMQPMVTGIQSEGQSPHSIKLMALRALLSLRLSNDLCIADIGAGRGDFEKIILPYVSKVTMVDDYEPEIKDDKIQWVKVNLNNAWGLESNKFDFVFSMEVIEHVENPRHFMREVTRILKPGGYGFITTPNNLNFFSKLFFFIKGEHRYFQDSCYPAHITCLVEKDLERMLIENGLQKVGFYYNHEDVMPLLGIRLKLKLAALSNSTGILFRKPSS